MGTLENYGKTMGKLWENYRNILENYGNNDNKLLDFEFGVPKLAYFQACHRVEIGTR